ncbi:MAG: cysteine--tRNA ligase [Candidatus Hydrogenedentota bacterium]
MPLQLFNTLTRKKELFEPLEPPKVRLYTCGPTVYNFAHIGNLRTFMFEDLLRRYLKFRGYEVFHVMNLTDIEDKIIRTCRETGESRESLVNRYAQAFFEDLDALGIERAEVYPKATDHIPEMVAMIQTLIERGHAYAANGSVYFKLSSFPHYGCLSHFNMDELQQGASGRVDSDEYETEDVRDFALWKAWDEDDGDIYWETALGKGRPGWHIECSAMAIKYMGESFDIHCGGIDNMFPHHENEIAQSEAVTGKQFVKYWLHAQHLLVEGRKMSKSFGNFYTLRDLMAQGHDPVAIRYLLISTDYRKQANFTVEALESAKNALRRIRDFRLRLEAVKMPSGRDLTGEAPACEKQFVEALDDDLNISAALASVFDFIRDTNKWVDRSELSVQGATRALQLLDRLNAVTGVFGSPGDQIPDEVAALVAERQKARRAKDFAASDAARDKLRDLGWVVEDTADGPRVKRL